MAGLRQNALVFVFLCSSVAAAQDLVSQMVPDGFCPNGLCPSTSEYFDEVSFLTLKTQLSRGLAGRESSRRTAIDEVSSLQFNTTVGHGVHTEKNELPKTINDADLRRSTAGSNSETNAKDGNRRSNETAMRCEPSCTGFGLWNWVLPAGGLDRDRVVGGVEMKSDWQWQLHSLRKCERVGPIKQENKLVHPSELFGLKNTCAETVAGVKNPFCYVCAEH